MVPSRVWGGLGFPILGVGRPWGARPRGSAPGERVPGGQTGVSLGSAPQEERSPWDAPPRDGRPQESGKRGRSRLSREPLSKRPLCALFSLGAARCPFGAQISGSGAPLGRAPQGRPCARGARALYKTWILEKKVSSFFNGHLSPLRGCEGSSGGAPRTRPTHEVAINAH